MDWIFVGDAHFGRGDGGRRNRFIRFIQRNKPSLNTLVIMGDLFDFWFGFRNLSPLQKQYGDILSLFEEIRGDGIQVIYLEGNHDFQLGPYMSEKLGIQVYNRSAQLDLDGNRIYLAHGDMAYPTVSHRIFSFFLKNRLAYRLMSWLGPQVVMGIATWLSSGSRKRGLQDTPETISRLRKFALHKLDEGFDAVILAHSHVPEQIAVERGEGTGCYFNVGNWMTDFSLLRYNGERGFCLEYFTAD